VIAIAAVIAVVAVVVWTSRIAAISRSRPVVAPGAVVITRAVVVAVTHIDVGLWRDRRAVAIVTVVGAVAVAVHRSAVRIHGAAAQKGGNGDSAEGCKAFHFKPELRGFMSMRPQL
jgi:hypothetical protein